MRAIGHSGTDTGCGCMSNLIFLSEQWQWDLELGEFSMTPLSGSDHSLVTGIFVHYLGRNTYSVRCSQWLIGLYEFQRKLWLFPDCLLHDPTEGLVITWNRSAANTLDWITLMQLLFFHGSHYSPWFTEELRVVKQIKSPGALLAVNKEQTWPVVV